MVKTVAAILFLLFSTVIFATTQQEFYEYRASQNATGMINLISKLKNTPLLEKDATTLRILADACVEYGLWGAPKELKAKYFDDAIHYADMALKITPNNAYLNFVKGAAIGRLAQYKGIIQSLFMLGDFDHYINKAIELDPKLYRAYVALAMRYRDTPWPFANFDRSEELFKKALSIDPGYIYGYYELAQLYIKWGKISEARQTFEKIVSMPVENEFYAQEIDCKSKAKKWLETHK